jgi:hypothetical protein
MKNSVSGNRALRRWKGEKGQVALIIKKNENHRRRKDFKNECLSTK